MKTKFSISILLLCFTVCGLAQKPTDDVLFTVDNDPIKTSEFIRVYNKNLDLIKDESQKDVDAYLQLFINYQLKLKEAKRLGLDKDANYLREFESYKKQLTKNFLSDSNVTEALVQEAYDRSIQDIKASHILIRLDENEKDTLQVYNNLVELRKRVLTEGFDKVQSEVHNGQTVFAENLGYFSAFKMVYPFENAAYKTQVGEVSLPFRTNFGFHIVSVEAKRPSLGEVTVAHIMITNNPADSLVNAEVRIQEIYKKINQGENFESLAKQFSDDKSSSAKGGVLTAFTGGQLSSQEFEDVAFGLGEIGAISKPFKTDYGWHIVKLIDKHGIQPIETIKADIENKVKRDSRSSLINAALNKKLKTTYKVVDSPKNLDYFVSVLNQDYYKRTWVLPSNFTSEKMIFKVGTKNFTYADFGSHLINVQKIYTGKNTSFDTIIEKEYQSFQEMVILKYHEDNLEYENEDFAHILKEYRDGLLLFELMEKQVWNAAVKDTIGLKTYYEAHKADYVWKERVDMLMATAAKKNNIEKVRELLQKGNSEEVINTQLNTDTEQNVIFTKGTLETDYQAFPLELELKKGLSKIYNYNDAYHVFIINEIIPSSPKSFEESKGKLISDYQNEIESNWLLDLSERYKVKINDEALIKVKSQILK